MDRDGKYEGKVYIESVMACYLAGPGSKDGFHKTQNERFVAAKMILKRDSANWGTRSLMRNSLLSVHLTGHD